MVGAVLSSLEPIQPKVAECNRLGLLVGEQDEITLVNRDMGVLTISRCGRFRTLFCVVRRLHLRLPLSESIIQFGR